MSNAVVIIQIISALIEASAASARAAAEYTALLQRTRAEGRDPTDEELADVRTRNQAATKDVLDKLE